MKERNERSAYKRKTGFPNIESRGATNIFLIHQMDGKFM
jgi:hypothetical protein